MTRKISKEGEEKIVQWEGEVLYAYDDFDPKHRPIMPGMPVKGTLTAGVGHTGPDVKPGMKITVAQSRAWLRQDIQKFEDVVSSLVKVPLTDNQFAALVSFAFNVGSANFSKSTLLKKLNAGHYDAVPVELMRWVHSKGNRMDGLVNRRAQEAALWGKGAFVNSHTVDAKPASPSIDRESVSWGAGILSSLAALFVGTGPAQWALAAVIVVAFGVGLWLFLSKRLSPE
jgi:lysozyme